MAVQSAKRVRNERSRSIGASETRLLLPMGVSEMHCCFGGPLVCLFSSTDGCIGFARCVVSGGICRRFGPPK